MERLPRKSTQTSVPILAAAHTVDKAFRDPATAHSCAETGGLGKSSADSISYTGLDGGYA